jgi:hypothetical protein
MAGFHTKTFLKHDDYMTPKTAWQDINEYIPKDKIIYEAFYGDGMSGQYLEELGCKKVIHKKKDFFTYTPKYDILISNPPFSLSKEIMKRLAELDKPFIVIMPSSKINTSYMRNNFINKGLQIIIPRKRIHFIKKINGEIPDKWKNSCNFDCFYYCYKLGLKNDITWLE